MVHGLPALPDAIAGRRSKGVDVMETIRAPKAVKFDVECENPACRALLRCRAEDLTRHDRASTALYQGGGMLNSDRSYWSMQCPHCRFYTNVYDLMSKVVP